jgi:hypothetical protein
VLLKERTQIAGLANLVVLVLADLSTPNLGLLNRSLLFSITLKTLLDFLSRRTHVFPRSLVTDLVSELELKKFEGKTMKKRIAEQI